MKVHSSTVQLYLKKRANEIIELVYIGTLPSIINFPLFSPFTLQKVKSLRLKHPFVLWSNLCKTVKFSVVFI